MKKDKTKYKIPSYIPMYPFGGELKGNSFGETLGNIAREKGLTMGLTGPLGMGVDILSKGKFSNWVNEHGALLGTVGGAAVGVAAGNPMMGAQIGGQLGGFAQQAEAKDDQYLLDEKNINNFNDRSLAQQRIMGLPQNQMSFGNGGKIYIKPENRGKFNATKARTGKTTEELTHSSNPITRKRAIFAQNAAKWKHSDGGYLSTNIDNTYTSSFKCGGKMANGGQLKGTKYNEDVTYYPNGGTHESSKLGGIPIGNKGVVEEKEVRFKDYIFSNRY